MRRRDLIRENSNMIIGSRSGGSDLYFWRDLLDEEDAALFRRSLLDDEWVQGELFAAGTVQSTAEPDGGPRTGEA